MDCCHNSAPDWWYRIPTRTIQNHFDSLLKNDNCFPAEIRFFVGRRFPWLRVCENIYPWFMQQRDFWSTPRSGSGGRGSGEWRLCFFLLVAFSWLIDVKWGNKYYWENVEFMHTHCECWNWRLPLCDLTHNSYDVMQIRNCDVRISRVMSWKAWCQPDNPDITGGSKLWG